MELKLKMKIQAGKTLYIIQWRSRTSLTSSYEMIKFTMAQNELFQNSSRLASLLIMTSSTDMAPITEIKQGSKSWLDAATFSYRQNKSSVYN